jgi:hypothetical protein
LQLSQVDTESRVLHVKRLKEGLSTTHPLRGDEIRAMYIAPCGRTLQPYPLDQGPARGALEAYVPRLILSPSS